MLNHSLVPVGSTGYDIDNSLRFNAPDSPHLTRTPSTAGNRKTWTWACWIKRGAKIGSYEWLFSANNNCKIAFNGNSVNMYHGSELVTNQVFRDPSAWYHLIWAVDTTQATASNRMKFYVNGEQVTSFSAENYPTQNSDTDMNNTVSHYIGKSGNASYPEYNDGYKAEMYLIDGQALTPADFGETDEDYGHWKAKKYTGSYGTNGFYLDFKNSGSLGNDASSNSNNWTPNNLAATDQMLDSPTNNFCTLNPLNPNGSPTYSEGNTKVVVYDYGMFGTQSMLTGKWYWENLPNSTSQMFGVVHEDSLSNTLKNTASGGLSTYGGTNKGRAYYGDGNKKDASTDAAYGATFTSGDIIGVAYDADIGSITFYKNGVSQGVAFSSLPSGEWLPLTHSFSSSAHYVNFGQDSSFAGNKTSQGNADDKGYGDFYYAPPTGYLALCTQNLPEPTVVPSEHFNTVLYTGDFTNNKNITGVGFQPDWLWIKGRTGTQYHMLFDAVRGNTKELYSNDTSAEGTDTGTVTSFDSDGFTIDADNDVNRSGTPFVAWNWKANGAGVSNTNGSITSTVSANVDAGFSIVSYTGNGTSGATYGHGLSSAPELIIYKSRTTTQWWGVKPASMSGVMFLNNTYAETTNTFVNSMSSSVINMTNDTSINDNTVPFIAYCFHSVEGYSKVGSYTGNGSTDGTFVHCGFRPAYVMWKRTDSTGNWNTFDVDRSPTNSVDEFLRPNTSAAESSGTDIVDLLSNGFKARYALSGTYIYLAFAEHPFKYTNAR